MKTWILTLAAVGALGVFAADTADAHGSKYRASRHVNVGISYTYGFGRYYRPYRYYGSYRPRTYVGINLWPRSTRRVRSTETSSTVRLKELYVYPAAGQSERRMADDRYECHTWSADQTGFDPTVETGRSAQADAYARALTACLEARGYVVR